MGKWAKNLFGKESFGKVGLVIAGSVKPEREKAILEFFDKVIFSKDSSYHAHLVRLRGELYPVITKVYGAPAMLDVITQMHDGGCNNLIFVGWAYSFSKHLRVGDIIVPEKAYHFDGVYHVLHPDKKFDAPDDKIKKALEGVLKKENIRFENGVNISVPAVTFQPQHFNESYRMINPTTIEMELAACLSRSRDIGVRAVGILIISDTRRSSIIKTPKKSNDVRIRVIKSIVDNFELFNLSKIPVKKKFNIDKHLASIIHYPDDRTNVYRES